MESCIYLRESQTALSYSSREHIISAGLGGIKRLPKGAVSDEINGLFSGREKIALRETFLAINRRNNGPGKRGSNNVKKILDPHVVVLETISNSENGTSETNYMPIKLGYLFYGEIHIIPQIYCEIRDDHAVRIPILSLGTLSEIRGDEYESFMKALALFLSKQYKMTTDYRLVKTKIEIKQNYISIGQIQNQWYIGTSLSDSALEKYLRLFEKRPLPDKTILIQEVVQEYHYSEYLPNAFNSAFTFIYAKTAFNVLAYLKSLDFVRDAQFDEIRSAIISGTNLNTFVFEQIPPQWLCSWVANSIPPKAHFVILYGHEQYIDAYVSFYRESVYYLIRLSKDYTGEEFRLFFFCNYLANEEKHGRIDL